jgi:hypothetical protein
MRNFLLLTFFNAGIIFSQANMSPFSDSIASSRVNPEFTDSLFSIAASQITFLEFEDCNNCALRAHVIIFILSNRFPELNFGKVWMFADSKLSSRKDYYKTHRKEYLAGYGICPLWGFHVAPAVILDDDTIIIDPSTQKKSVPLSKWVSDISPNTASYIILKDSKYYMYPEDEFDLFNDKLPSWEQDYEFKSTSDELNFIALKLTNAYQSFYDPHKYNYYKYAISKLITAPEY